MGKKLIIVESPAKAKTIGKFVGNKFEIKASMGHVRDLPKSTFGVDVENDFKPKYVTDKTKTKIIKQLKESAKACDEIFLASDHDREGEAIAWHLAELLKKEIGSKPLHRIVFNEITKKAIKDSIKKPDVINIKKVNSQQTRRILDRIVGYDISPVLWKTISKGLSAGRVQSVALRIICEREAEINKFIPKEYWNVSANFSDLKNDTLASFKAVLTKYNNKKIEISDKETAEKLTEEIKNSDYQILDIKKTSRKVQPYPPYITSTLQQDAARLFNFTAKKTMMIAQQLYEGITLSGDTVGLISYMRTDSLRIANEAIESCRNLITERFGAKELFMKVRAYKNKSSSQDAHEAVRPTDPYRTPETIKHFLSTDQLKLYSMIWGRFMATQMKPISLDTATVEISAGKALFVAKGSIITDEGFLQVYPYTKVALGEKIDIGYKKGSMLKMENLKADQNFTKPPARYSESSLIKELEAKGIGRPSTYAAITNTIQIRKYVEKKAKLFYPTELGLMVNRVLVGNFENFFNVKFTAEMEESLDAIEYGKRNLVDVLSYYYKSLDDLIKSVDLKKVKASLVEETDIVCEKCDSKMVVKWGRNGQFLACSNYPTCKNTKNFTKDENGKISVVKEEKIADEKLDEKCPKCGSDLVIKKGRFGKFIACSNYPKCKFTRAITTGITCPDCGKGEIVEKRSKRGKTFYSCTNYPECKFITNYKPIKLECVECKNPYIEERYSKEKGNYKVCPKCGKEYI